MIQIIIMKNLKQKTCEKLGIAFVAFSPMASGFLSGKYNKDTKYEGDM